MYIYLIVIILLCIVLALAWLLWREKKKYSERYTGIIEALKKDFAEDYYEFIHAIENNTDKSEGYRLLLTHIKDSQHLIVDLEEYTKSDKLKYETVKKELENKDLSIINISHKMRTSLGNLIGFSQLLSTTSMDKEQKEFSSMVEISAKELLDIVNNIREIDTKSELLSREKNNTWRIRI